MSSRDPSKRKLEMREVYVLNMQKVEPSDGNTSADSFSVHRTFESAWRRLQKEKGTPWELQTENIVSLDKNGNEFSPASEYDFFSKEGLWLYSPTSATEEYNYAEIHRCAVLDEPDEP